MLLHELEFLEIIKRKRKGAGRGEGGYMETHLLDTPEIVRHRHLRRNRVSGVLSWTFGTVLVSKTPVVR